MRFQPASMENRLDDIDPAALIVTLAAGITADPPRRPVDISLAPTTPALPRGKPSRPRAEPVRAATIGARPTRKRIPGVLYRSPGAFWGSLRDLILGISLPHVALVLQWRQDHPKNRPPTRATAISEMGQLPTFRPLSDALELV